VASVIEGSLRIARVAIANEDIALTLQGEVPGLQVAFHPSALRQVLLGAILELGRHITSGEITLTPARDGGRVCVTIAGGPLSSASTIELSQVEELLAVQGGTLVREADADRVLLKVDLPVLSSTGDEIVVLVIDDNLDWFSLYESYCTGTPYELVHISEGGGALEAIQSIQPDVILLDVMLPDVDGWDLLLDLHNTQATRDIPIIVSSVIRGEDLALTLGASRYLRKPVYRQELIDAFEHALNRDAEAP
jgi:CheY-like chemotaxis protein